MTEMTVVTSAEVLGQQLKIYGTAESPLFLAGDVADWIGHTNVTAMIASVDSDEVTKQSLGGLRGECNFLTESGLYEVLMLSRKPVAKAFKREVKRILREVRTKGGYLATSATDTPETIMARAVLIAADTIERQKRELSEAKEQLDAAAPKVAFVETFAASSGNILVRDYAKHIAQALGLRGFGQDRMFTWLRENNYMNINRYPTQRAIDSGFLHVTEGIHCHHDGSTGLHHCTRITPKGQAHFFGKIRAQVMAESEAQND